MCGPERNMSIADGEQDETGWGVLAELPGHPMMWVLIFSELVAFGLFLGTFSVARVLNRNVFLAGQATLDTTLAGINTAVLLTSGWAAARATTAARRGARTSVRLWLTSAIGLGVVFVAIKLVEYAADLAFGAGLDTSAFYTLYFLLTGFHLAHVMLGIIILALVSWRGNPVNVETATSFWHMVDLIWVMMFPILYLVR